MIKAKPLNPRIKLKPSGVYVETSDPVASALKRAKGIAVAEAPAERWTSQRRFIATAWHVNSKWGTSGEAFKCGICRRLFKVGDSVRWVMAVAHRCFNFFVCDHDDTSDVLDVWQRITEIAQRDEYDLAAKIVQLQSDLDRCAEAERSHPADVEGRACAVKPVSTSGDQVEGNAAADVEGLWNQLLETVEYIRNDDVHDAALRIVKALRA